MAELWTLDDLKAWTRELLKSRRVVAPVPGPGGAMWAEVKDPESIAWDYTRTTVSPREWLIPRTEQLFTYDLMTKPPTLTEPPLDDTPTVLLLLRPCDVAGLRALDAVMRWDYTDEGYEAKRGATLFVALGCAEPASKDACFCEAAGVDPRFAPEADLSIEKVAAGGKTQYRMFAVTEAGKALAQGAPRGVEPPPVEYADLPVGTSEAVERAAARQRAVRAGTAAAGASGIGTVPVDLAQAVAWLRDMKNFDDPVWQEMSDSCVGCGACAYLCPSCHCFDVVDEGDWRRGARVRNWDSCAFGHFTAHATGHNPRSHQWNRWRQRVYHKFVYYPQKFGRLLCTGCGRCVDACPGGMDLIDVLQTVASRASAAGGGAAAPVVAAPSGGKGAKR